MIYRRLDSNWIGPAGKNDASVNYWRAQARKLFARFPGLEAVEIVRTGRKTDAENVRRGASHSAPGIAVIIASTGGKWGKSRRDFLPANP